MNKRLLVSVLLLLVIGGCGAPMTEDNPLGISDPNHVQEWVNFGVSIGQTTQAVGVATGNPAMIGYGAVLVVLGGWITNNILKKGKKNGES